MAAIDINYNKLRNPEIKEWVEYDFHDELFDTTAGHDHDGVNSKTLSASAVVANDSVTTVKILDANVTAPKLAAASVTTVKIADLNVTTAKIAADAIDGTKLADNAVNSEHYTDGSIDLVHLSADCVDGTKIADDAIDSEHYTDASIDTAHIALDAIDGTLIADDAINSEHYTDGSIDTAHIADDQVTNAKLANIARGFIKVGGAADAPTDLNAKTNAYILIGDGTDVGSVAVSGDVTIANTGAVTIANLAVETGMIAADAIDGTKLADNAVDSEHYTDASIDLAHMSANSVDSDQYVDGSIDTIHLAATTTPNAKTIVAAAEAAIPVTGNGDLALTIADAAETNTLAVPTFAGQQINISADTLAGTGTRTITVASAINITGNNTILFDAAGQFISLYGIKLGATFAWRVLANDSTTLTTVA